MRRTRAPLGAAPRAALGAALGVALAAALIAGCTAGGSAAPAGGSAAATGSAAAAAPSAVRSPETPSPPAASSPPATPLPTAPSPSAAPPAEPVPGLYGLDRLHPQTRGSTTTFATTRTCRQVLGTVGAGQWRATVLATPKDVPEQVRTLMSWYLVSLQRGSDTAYLKLVEGAEGCDGTLTLATTEHLTLSGAETRDAPAMFIPFQCGPALLERDSMTVTGFYDSGDVHLLLNLSFPARTGTQPLDRSDGDPPVQLVRGGDAMLERYARAYVDALRDGETPSTVNGSTAFAIADATTATVRTTSLAPLAGTATIRGLAGPSGKLLTVTAGFRCDNRPASPSSAAPRPPALGGDQSASTSGTSTVTVTVGSGPRKGTYHGTGSLRCNHHEFGPDSWWLVFAGDDGPGSDDPATVTLLNLWSQPTDRIGKESAYSEPYLLDIGFGNFVVDRDAQIHVGTDAGGRGGPITVKGTTVTATATTAGKVAVTITARCT